MPTALQNMALLSRRTCGWRLVMLAAFLVAVPAIRTSESNEFDSAKERVEDASLVVRSSPLRRATLHGRQERVVFTAAHPFLLGHSQQVSPASASGHRLSNGLMAPMTC